jgi:hypothetical protein
MHKRFAPVIHFHPEEKYFPITLQEYTRNSDFVELDGALLEESPTLVHLASTKRKDVSLRPGPNVLSGTLTCENLDTFPLMYSVTEEKHTILIQYHIFFAFNGAYKPFGCSYAPNLPFSDHNADWESIVMKFEKEAPDEQIDLLNDEGKSVILQSIYFGSHTSKEGVWVDANDVLYTNGTHPHVYISLNGHGCYPKPKTYYRGCGIANDYCSDQGIVWIPKNFELFDEKHVGYQYDGYLGFPDHVVMPHRQSRWKSSNMTSTNACKRFFCCLKCLW